MRLSLAATLLALLASAASADELWPGDCRAKVQDRNGDTEWFAWRGVDSCSTGVQRGEVDIRFVNGRVVTQQLGGEVIKLVFRPGPQIVRER